MKQKLFILLALAIALSTVACSTDKKQTTSWEDNSIEAASHQLKFMTELIADSAKLPRSTKNGEVRLEGIHDWTSGFFPGTLWYMYELTNNEYFKTEAQKFTNLLHDLRYYRDTHDLGFMIFCSYGNDYRITDNEAAIPIMVETADNLISRFNETTQTIRSWDFGEWQFPVIIDNMMNLELLFWASEYTGDDKYKDVAIRHADTTMKYHYRDDYSSYHVVDYDTISGDMISQGTFQGYSDESIWARGQAWGLYGYTVMYRFTKDQKYLDFAQNIASLIMDNVETEDLIPYWDYDAPNIPDAPRDASAASVTASALLELSKYVDNDEVYFNYAETVLKNLSSNPYLAEKEDNLGFILKHSTGNLPNNSEIDIPLNYADYYYLEALKRYINF